jgi:CRP/FNR family transcriptional regulator
MADSAESKSPAPGGHGAIISIRDLKSRCSACSMREFCLPGGLDPTALHELDRLVTSRIRFRKGAAIYRTGDPFKGLYAVRVGSCKTAAVSEDGREQVIGYHMFGDLLGLDGIANERHECDAIALEDTEACVIPFGQLEDLARRLSPLQHNLHQFLSREIGRDRNVMVMLGSMRAEEKLASFLLTLSERFQQHGYSATEFMLRMTREEIGSYLGLKLETVSRLLSRFQSKGLLQIEGRAVKLLDLSALRQLSGCATTDRPTRDGGLVDAA